MVHFKGGNKMNIEQLDVRLSEIAERHGLKYIRVDSVVPVSMDVFGSYNPVDKYIKLQRGKFEYDELGYKLGMVVAFFHEMGHHLDHLKHRCDGMEFFRRYQSSKVEFEKRAWVYGIMLLVNEAPDLFKSKLRVYLSDSIDDCLKSYGADTHIIASTQKAIHEIRKAVEL
jgi:hypothetical protein